MVVSARDPEIPCQMPNPQIGTFLRIEFPKFSPDGGSRSIGFLSAHYLRHFPEFSLRIRLESMWIAFFFFFPLGEDQAFDIKFLGPIYGHADLRPENCYICIPFFVDLRVGRSISALRD